MDPKLYGHSGMMSRFKFNKQAFAVFPEPHTRNSLNAADGAADGSLNGYIRDGMLVSSQCSFDTGVQSSEGDSHEDCDFSDAILKYINHILMEEDVEDKACMFQESAALQAEEKSFYEVIGQQYPTSGYGEMVPNMYQSIESPDEKFSVVSRSYWQSDSESPRPEWHINPPSNRYEGHHATSNPVSQTTSSSYSSSGSNGTVIDFPGDSPVSHLRLPDIFSDNESAIQFKKGVEEARKFLPRVSNLIAEVKYEESVEKIYASMVAKLENKSDNEDCLDLSRGKKNPYRDSMGWEVERSSKQSAVYTEATLSPDMFDKVLLCSGGKNESALRKELSEVSKSSTQNGQSKGSSGGKRHGKSQGGKRKVVDLRTLLTLCAQAVAADDQRTANNFLKQIRQHATPTGDGMQRLAHYFADGLEARMAGSGTQIYTSLINMPTSASDILKAYHIYLATCPFRKISNFFANKTIMTISEKATRVHIVDFGILYGFQWPCFMQRLSSRPGGPPKLRITGIDFPCPGFRPSERVEETGRRLARYAETFKVPFEFNAIAQKWETIKVEDIKIEDDELLVVNCLFRLRNLLDETVMVSSPRNMVLNLVRKMNPAVFVMGILNGAYNAPFFVTRFREALFHYSSFFDMLEANIPREVHERMLLERTLFGREAMNVIACEGAERIERPETYKQWQVRIMRPGFEQLPLSNEIMEMTKDRVKSSYHKDFVIDEDGKWMLLGWKGRILHALSSWRPTY